MTRLETMIQELPPELQQEVEDFVQFLLEKHVPHPQRQFSLDWRGALANIRNKYTSVELQRRAWTLDCKKEAP